MTTQTNIQEVSDDVLRTLDFAIGIDTSGSTDTTSHRLPGKTRLQEMQEEAGRIIRGAGKYDDDGLTLVMFASGARVIDNVTPERITAAFKEMHSGGNTNLGACIREFGKKAHSSAKPFVGFIFTDGEASNPDDVITAIWQVANLTQGRPKFGMVIVQTGNDAEATQYLKQLDDQLGSKGIPDMIAVVTEDESEGLTFPQLVWLAQNA